MGAQELEPRSRETPIVELVDGGIVVKSWMRKPNVAPEECL